MIIGPIRKDEIGRGIVARDLLLAADASPGKFMYLELRGRGATRGENCTIYPGLRGSLCNVNPNTGHTVVVVAVSKVQAWARRVLGETPERNPMAGRKGTSIARGLARLAKTHPDLALDVACDLLQPKKR